MFFLVEFVFQTATWPLSLWEQ